MALKAIYSKEKAARETEPLFFVDNGVDDSMMW